MIGGFEMVLQYACLARLAKYTNSSDTWEWEPSEFVTSISQPDDKTITFELKPDIMWYDGSTHEAIGELDAEDVKYSSERMKVSEWKDKAVALDHVEVTGTHSGAVHLNQPFAPVWLTWRCDGTGAVLSKKAVEMAGGKYDGIFNFYCGPYRVAEWVQKQSFTLEPNPNWSGSPPGVADVKFTAIDDIKTAELAFEAEEIDITHVAAESIPRLLVTPPRIAACTIIQANLAEVGLDVEVVPMDAGPFWNLGLETEGDDWKDLELWLMAYLDSPDPSQMTQWYVSDQVGIWNWERWSDPEFDELSAKSLSTPPLPNHALSPSVLPLSFGFSNGFQPSQKSS